jgi:hypothetical protein
VSAALLFMAFLLMLGLLGLMGVPACREPAKRLSHEL